MSGYGRWPHRQYAEGRQEQRTLLASSLPTSSTIVWTTTELATTFEQVIHPEHLLEIYRDLRIGASITAVLIPEQRGSSI